MKSGKQTEKNWCRLLLLGALCVYILKNIFVGADIDEGYGIVLGYRLAIGDRLLLDMWEPHQTSGIFTALFIRPFLLATGGSLDFLNIYLRIVYFLIQGGISWLLFWTLQSCVPGVDKKTAGALALVFFACSPKSIFIPEYSNLHMWFFALLCMSLIWYLGEQSPLRGQGWLAAAAGLALTCDVLAYPSMAVLLPVCLGLLLCRGGGKRWRACGLFVLPCGVLALSLGAYLLSYMTWEQIGAAVGHVLGDGSHQTEPGGRLLMWLTAFGKMGLVLIISLGAAWGIAAACCRIRKELDRAVCFFTAFCMIHIVRMFYIWFTSQYNAAYSRLIYLGLGLLGIWCWCRVRNRGRNQGQEKAGLWLILLSWVSYLAVLLLSNWEPFLLTPYLVMGAIGGFLCWRAYLGERKAGKGAVLVCSAVLACSCLFGYTFRIIGGELVPSTLLEVRGYNHEGFRKGILTSYMTAYRYNKNAEIWAEAVPEGSAVLYVGPSQFFYMLGDCVIATPNTISTPVYDESLLAYWEQHPDRYPDVVVFESWYGDIRVVEEDSFIMQWVKNEFQASEVEEYPYITVYKN